MREEAERSYAIGERDVDDAFRGEMLAAVVGHRRRPDGEAAAVDPDDDRHERRARIVWRRPDVQVKAILARRLFAEVVIDVVRAQRLNAFGRGAIGMIGPLPRGHRLRWTPTQLAHRRRCERHAEVRTHAGIARSVPAMLPDSITSGSLRIALRRGQGAAGRRKDERHAQCCNSAAVPTYHAGGSGRVDLLCTYQFVNTITSSPSWTPHCSSTHRAAPPRWPPAKRTHARFAILALLTVGTLINYLDRTVISVAAPLLSRDLGLSAVAMGVVFSAFSWTYAAAQIPGGILLDRIGVRAHLLPVGDDLVRVHPAAGTYDEPVVADCVPDGAGHRRSAGLPVEQPHPGHMVSAGRARDRDGRVFDRSVFRPRLPEPGAVLDSGHFRLARAADHRRRRRHRFRRAVVCPVPRSAREPREPGGARPHRRRRRPRPKHARPLQVAPHRIPAAAAPDPRRFDRTVRQQLHARVLPDLVSRPISRPSGRWAGSRSDSSPCCRSSPRASASSAAACAPTCSCAVPARPTSRARRPIIVGLLLASTIVIANFVTRDTVVIAIMSAAFFGQGMCNLGWTLLTDVAPKQLMGLSGGVFNLCANLAGIVTPLVVGIRGRRDRLVRLGARLHRRAGAGGRGLLRVRGRRRAPRRVCRRAASRRLT